MTETGPRATDEDVLRFEQHVGYVLPPDYRKFLLDVNGGHASITRWRPRLCQAVIVPSHDVGRDHLDPPAVAR